MKPRLAGWLVGWLAGWLLAGWMAAGCLAGWLPATAGWLAGPLAELIIIFTSIETQLGVHIKIMDGNHAN